MLHLLIIVTNTIEVDLMFIIQCVDFSIISFLGWPFD